MGWNVEVLILFLVIDSLGCSFTGKLFDFTCNEGS